MSDSRSFASYVVLFGSSLFINKYVLSVLKFSYPTVFQGWQTLVGGVLLKVLLAYKYIAASPTELDKAGFISLLPSFLFFSAGIVAGSKALTSLSVPVFLCLQNTLGALLYLLEIAPTFQGSGGVLALAASLVSITTAVMAVLADIGMMFSDSPYFWMIAYLACMSVQTLHSKIADARYSDVDRLYFSYIFSVVILAPASLYLEEAFEVLHFPNASRFDFYIGCLLSGVLGLFLNLCQLTVKFCPLFSTVDALGRVMTSSVSLLLFVDATPHIVKALVFANLVAGIFIPLSNSKEEVKVPLLEENEPV